MKGCDVLVPVPGEREGCLLEFLSEYPEEVFLQVARASERAGIYLKIEGWVVNAAVAVAVGQVQELQGDLIAFQVEIVVVLRVIR